MTIRGAASDFLDERGLDGSVAVDYIATPSGGAEGPKPIFRSRKQIVRNFRDIDADNPDKESFLQ